MAGIGAAPKDPSQRRNRSAPMRGEWVDLAPLGAPVLPELPAGEWLESTVEMWEAWRADPVTAQWTASDVAYAKATIRMFEDPKIPPNELRLRMDGLGLTPKGKRDLRWRVPTGDGPVKSRKAPKAAADRRARLSVVE